MSVIEDIRKHISELPQDMLFTTRDLLNYGPRSAIDNAIYKLVQNEEIVRIVPGVFKNPLRSKPVEFLELARVKAQSFGRDIITHPVDAAVQVGLLFETDNIGLHVLFATNGRTSKFRFGPFTIHFKGTSSRKMELGDSLLGKAIRALCFMGEKNISEETFNLATDWLCDSDLEEGGGLCALMPAWLSEYFCPFFRMLEKQIRSVLLYNEINESKDRFVKEPTPERRYSFTNSSDSKYVLQSTLIPKWPPSSLFC